MVGSVRRRLRVCLHVRQVLAQRAQVFEPRGGRGLLIAGCKCPAGSRNGVGTPRATQGTGPLESCLENPRPGPPSPSLSLAHSLCEAGNAAGQCGLGEIAQSFEWQGGLLCPRTGAHGACETAVTPQGWVTRLLKGGSGDPSRVGHVTSQRWVTRPLKCGSRDTSRVGHETLQWWVR